MANRNIGKKHRENKKTHSLPSSNQNDVQAQSQSKNIQEGLEKRFMDLLNDQAISSEKSREELYINLSDYINLLGRTYNAKFDRLSSKSDFLSELVCVNKKLFISFLEQSGIGLAGIDLEYIKNLEC